MVAFTGRDSEEIEFKRKDDIYPRTIEACLEELSDVVGTIRSAETRKRELLEQIKIIKTQHEEIFHKIMETAEVSEGISRGERY